ncbi:MAG TPA: Sir2 family NAD-dependent protein deacetylase [Acidimicrobiales bacterium]|nr:Sir2 family NAD-dependent protein deacetylase [Acidimicrobiales bacterium]
MAESSPDVTEELLEQVQGWLAAAERIVALTGAGISTDSGIPDYRGPQGVWTKNPEAEKMASLSHYLEDPEVRKLSWRNRLRSPAWEARPNAGHLALVDLERSGRLLALITQNVDGLHLLAGSSPERVIEIHGNMRYAVCWSCGDRRPMGEVLERVRGGEEDPACRQPAPGGGECGGVIKSDTISFGQSLVAEDLARAERAALGCDLLLAVGSSLTVHPAAGVVPVAASSGARVVIVNAEPTPYDRLADAVIRGSISEVLPTLVGASAG